MVDELKNILSCHLKKKKAEKNAKNLIVALKNIKNNKQLRSTILAQTKTKTKQLNLLRKVQESTLTQLTNLATSKCISTDSPYFDYKILKCAIKYKRRDLALFLLKHGCRVNKVDSKMNTYSIEIGITPLHHAVVLNDKELVIKLLAKGASVSVGDKQGNTPLHLAFISKKYSLVKELLPFSFGGSKNNIANKHGITHMHIASASNNVIIVQNFLACGVPVDHIVDFKSSIWPGCTALHFAVEFQAVEVVRILLAANANLDFRNGYGVSPRSLSYKLSQETSMVDYLFCKGITNTNAQSGNMLTNFHIACLKEKSDVVERFLKNGACVEETVDSRDPFYALCTPLHMAVESGDLEKVRLLLSHGAYVERQNIDYMTPLHLALYSEDPDGINSSNCSIVNLLYSKFSPENYNLIDLNGMSFLHIACSRNDFLLAKKMIWEEEEDIDSQVMYNLRNFALFTPLHFAVRYHAKETIHFLLKNGADVNCSDNGMHGVPIHLALEVAAEPEIIDSLVSAGAWLNAIRPFDDRSLLHILIDLLGSTNVPDKRKKRIEIIRKSALYYVDLFCSHDCNVDAQDSDGNTAFHLACSLKNVKRDVIDSLLNWGANINLENHAGKTPFEVAKHPHSLIIYDHVQKLLAANLPINPRNLSHSTVVSDKMIDFESKLADQRKKDYLVETKILEGIYVDKTTTLLDILRIENPSALAPFCNNLDAFHNFVESKFFDGTCTNYASLLKLQYKRGVKARIMDYDRDDGRKRKRPSDDS